MIQKHKIAVIIPTYDARDTILDVIRTIPAFVDKIYIIDDGCPSKSGRIVSENCKDNRVYIFTNKTNLGVGGATIIGYENAIKDKNDILVKMDSDGQMDPKQIERLLMPIINGNADYTKGNRFHNIEDLRQMPKIRVFGNGILSFINKLSSGYWDIFDPTNGYTALHVSVAQKLQFGKIEKDYCFETDLLFRLGLLRAVVWDIPMQSIYGNERSGLIINKLVFKLLALHSRNLYKRIFYNYYLRDLSIASIELILGIVCFLFGLYYGLSSWFVSSRTDIPATAGTVMMSALPLLIGMMLFLGFLHYDIANVPKKPIKD